MSGYLKNTTNTQELCPKKKKKTTELGSDRVHPCGLTSSKQLTFLLPYLVALPFQLEPFCAKFPNFKRRSYAGNETFNKES